MNKNVLKIGIGIVGSLIMIFAIIFGVFLLVKEKPPMTYDEAKIELAKMLKEVNIVDVPAEKARLSAETLDLSQELPNIDKYPLTVKGNAPINIEIFSSTEKSGKDTDGWLCKVAENFNKENQGRISVSIRCIPSGDGNDYIISGKYLPDGFTPSNELWGKMIESKGIDINLVSKKLCGNVAGILMNQNKYDEFVKTYGDINVKNVVKATSDGKLAMGYTNPFPSSTGLNWIVSTLSDIDKNNPFSENAVKGFENFQANVPYVAYTTLQMRNSAQKSGTLDAMVLEYQTYKNTNELNNFKFVPFGVRHDSPLYSIGNISQEKKELLEKFANYCQNNDSQQLASKYGFNGFDDYKTDVRDFSGSEIASAQKLWKEKKDSGRSISAVFVADISGSMGTPSKESNVIPLESLKASLLNSMQYINKNNSVGFISYNINVYRNLPIGKFDLNQQALFTGVVKNLTSSENTSTYNAVLVALDMLIKEKETNPNAKLILFLLSDGLQNRGFSFAKVEKVIRGLGISVNTIGYNKDIAELEKLSDINEGASKKADSEDLIYIIRNFFNAEL